MVDLLRTRRFLPLFITQFLGAFNDNLFKNALVILITYRLAEHGNAQMLVTLAAGIFILPYLLFSATAGQLADKYDRARLARLTKVWEIMLSLLATIGFYTGHVYFLLLVLFGLGTQSTFFGPIKYALLPQHLRQEELIEGNAYIEAATFLAILLGTIVGGLLVLREQGVFLISFAIFLVALSGYIASRYIPPAVSRIPTLKPDWNIFRASWDIVKCDIRNRRVFTSILGISWFWLIGATYLSQFPTYAKDIIGGDETVVTLFLTMFSLGIGAGAFVCNKLLRGSISSRYLPVAAAGITLFTIDLYLASSNSIHSASLIDAMGFLANIENWRVLFDLFMVAACGGVYIVPLYAIMQNDSVEEHRARTIATNNIFNALFMVMAALGTMVMLEIGASVPQVFLAVAIINAPVAILVRHFNRRTIQPV